MAATTTFATTPIDNKLIPLAFQLALPKKPTRSSPQEAFRQTPFNWLCKKV